MTNLEQNLSTLQEKIYSLNLDISKSYLPESEISKNILLSKNPKMSKDDADIMIDGKISDDKTSTTSQNSDDIKLKEKTANFAKQNGIYPLSKDGPIYNEARKIKNEARQAFMIMVKEQKELIQDLIKVAIDSVSAISAAAILCAPVSFNVPGAIVLVLKVLDAISKIISKVMNIIMSCEPLKYLPLLLPKDSFESSTSPINTAILTITGILSVVGFFQTLISTLMGGLSKTTDPENLKPQIESIKEKISEAEGELQEIRGDSDSTQRDISDKEFEIFELKGRLDIMIKGPNIPPMNDRGEFEEQSLSEILKKIDANLSSQINDMSAIKLQLYNYVYDVKLPDGSILNNLKEEEFEDIKQKYNVVFNNENSD